LDWWVRSGGGCGSSKPVAPTGAPAPGAVPASAGAAASGAAASGDANAAAGGAITPPPSPQTQREVERLREQLLEANASRHSATQRADAAEAQLAEARSQLQAEKKKRLALQSEVEALRGRLRARTESKSSVGARAASAQEIATPEPPRSPRCTSGDGSAAYSPRSPRSYGKKQFFPSRSVFAGAASSPSSARRTGRAPGSFVSAGQGVVSPVLAGAAAEAGALSPALNASCEQERIHQLEYELQPAHRSVLVAGRVRLMAQLQCERHRALAAATEREHAEAEAAQAAAEAEQARAAAEQAAVAEALQQEGAHCAQLSRELWSPRPVDPTAALRALSKVGAAAAQAEAEARWEAEAEAEPGAFSEFAGKFGAAGSYSAGLGASRAPTAALSPRLPPPPPHEPEEQVLIDKYYPVVSPRARACPVRQPAASTPRGVDGMPLVGGISSRLVLGQSVYKDQALYHCVHSRPPPSLAPTSHSVPTTPRRPDASPAHRPAPTPEAAATGRPANAWTDDAAAVAAIVNAVAKPAP
jgi:hypothetical protein